MKPLHARTYQILTLILSFILLALIGKFLIGSSTTTAADGRQAISLTAGEVSLIRSDMRLFLTTIQRITQGVAEDDMARVAETAKAMGSDQNRAVPITLMAKLPSDFRKLDFALHGELEAIAALAEAGEKAALLGRLSSLLQRCNTCHEGFTLKVL
ncbi:MAG: hypothetical protein L3J94_01965 [Gammaproteobacteria bacterium]|nr:hypothetical protein [Gammaproteobacteria bacterium]